MRPAGVYEHFLLLRPAAALPSPVLLLFVCSWLSCSPGLPEGAVTAVEAQEVEKRVGSDL
jgi:hypothetical protein